MKNTPKPVRLTARQQAVLKFIRDQFESNGYPPTRREIAEGLGVSWQAAQQNVGALRKKGAIRCTPGVSRGISLCDTSWPWRMTTSKGEALGLVWSIR